MDWWKEIPEEDEQLDKSHYMNRNFTKVSNFSKVISHVNRNFTKVSNFSKVISHVIWTTDKQQSVLHPSLRKKLFPYMTEYCACNDIKLDCLNGHAENVHCLFPYTLDTDLAHNIYRIRKETENWIKKHKFIEGDEDFPVNRKGFPFLIRNS